MATSAQVLEMLIPTGGWVVRGDTWDGVEFIEANPITKAQFEAGFAQYEAWKAKQEATEAAKKQSAKAKLTALGLTVDDLKALGL